MKRTFWITDGVSLDDPYYIVMKVPRIFRCKHCYKKDCEGFVSVGLEYLHNDRKVYQYEICNSCLYNPSQSMIEKNFITISKNKDKDYFNKIIYEYYKVIDKNKKAYEELIK